MIGGGDSACEEASYLSKFGSTVTMLVRRDVLRASKAMQQRVMNDPKITIMWNTNATETIGEQNLTQVKVRNNKTGEEQTLDAGGLFYAIGHTPNTEFVGGQLEADEAGYLITRPDSTQTGIDGVFIETHPDCSHALCDASTMLELNRLEELLKILMEIDSIVKGKQ